ncbi:helix-turn-helix domain-containing protein [Paracidovorax cattleyae]|uniref:helix-turn-helix domain-containing protein n=1 Tax=Paracidovorax cattleyae TaxID=80868 RepID=UPI0018AFE092|nr:helix-turn-helix domain-containing protein [Paracidovorax cattleyae]MBF9263584.1 helix-turn-helix domain-containing protein [Paracidovorax cattleyae]
MHPEEIKAAIRMAGTTPTAIAEELNVSRSMVSHVIYSKAKSERIAQRIAQITGRSLEVLWPTSSKRTPLRRKLNTAPSRARAAA